MDRICAFPGCDRQYRCSGVCASHYRQLQRGKNLTPLRVGNYVPQILFDVDVNGCHVYRGTKSAKGYGLVRFQRKQVFVHRYVWERENGRPIPEGMVIDHICRNHPCCNIEHLRLVTIRENVLENSVSLAAMNKAKTHCAHGHEFTTENTYVYEATGERQCRECSKLRRLAAMKKRDRDSDPGDDMSRSEFAAACHRHGFKGRGFLGYYALPCGIEVSILNVPPPRTRRAALAYLIEQERKHQK